MDETSQKKESIIVIKKSTLKIAVLILVAFVVGMLFDKGITGFFIAPTNQENQTQPTQPTQQPTQPTQQPLQEPTVQVSVDDDPSMGDSKAPITMIEFSDFQCPYCARFYTEAFSDIKKNYIDTGKVKFVYRDFPLSMHQYAQKAAEAAECAEEQGKYWEYNNALYTKQETWSSTGIEGLKQIASDLKLDTTKFNDCLTTGKYTSEVQKDLRDGAAAGVSGTPTFFIGTPEKGYQKLVGAQPFSMFKQTIDPLLV